MRIAVFVGVFLVGIAFTAFWLDELTVCPPLEEPDAFHVAVNAWPPAALECTVEHPDGSTAVRTYVPWQQWFAVAIAAFGIAIFTPPVPDDEVKWVRRALVTLALLVAGVGLWFF